MRFSEECEKLAFKCSQAVDYPKTGEPEGGKFI